MKPQNCSDYTVKIARMSDEILVHHTDHETQVAVIVNGTVQELHIERTSVAGWVGNVYLGKVARVLPGMQSAFIDIGLERAAFLHVADMWEHRAGKQNNPAALLPIERLLFEGQPVIAQVIKDPIGTKGARLTTHISLAGRTLVYLPQEKHVGISQKIGNEIEREALRARLAAVTPQDMSGGFIIRTLAEDATDAELAADVRYLQATWMTLTKRAATDPAPALLHKDLSLAERVLRDMAGEQTLQIRVDHRDLFTTMRAFADEYTPSMTQKIVLYAEPRGLFDVHHVDEELAKALARRVDLKSGGYLIIDQTEALTTIDVNTGGYVGSRNFEDTVFRTNLEAAQVIARQLRLRNLGGIIILDFIDMTDATHRDQVIDELKRALANDRVRTTVNGFTSLGLVEMTRKRTRESLSHVLCEACPTCEGRGEIKTAQTVCYEILRELEREALQFNPREFRVVAAQSVVDRFLDEDSQYLALLTERIGKPISLTVENTYPQERYDIVLS
jgi:ribonuclease G